MPVRELQDCDDLFEKRLVQEVQSQGVSIVHQVGSCYTVGLTHSYGHPELIVFGLPADRGQTLLLQATAAIADGQVWSAGEQIDSLTRDYPLRVQDVQLLHHREYLSYNRWFYRGDHFRSLQLVWPDADHHFPDHPDYLPHLHPVQPQLLQ